MHLKLPDHNRPIAIQGVTVGLSCRTQSQAGSALTLGPYRFTPGMLGQAADVMRRMMSAAS